MLRISITCMSLLLLSCNKDTVPSSPTIRFTEQINVDGLNRSYIVRLPQQYYDSTKDWPLVVGLHGTGGNGAQFETGYGMSAKADEAGFIAVYPEGVVKADGRGLFSIRTWNAGSCCDYAMYSNINDVKFIKTLINNLSDRFRVDRKRIYITGMSNGGMMAYRLASELSDQIAAVAIVSGNMVAPKDPALTGAVPILHIHAKADTKVPFNGGTGIGAVQFPPVMDGILYWVKRNNCDTVPTVEYGAGYQVQRWSDAAGRAPIHLYLTDDGGHAWPSSSRQGRWGDEPSTALHATNLVWEFMSRYSLP